MPRFPESETAGRGGKPTWNNITIVIANDVGLVLSRQALLSGVDVYSASIRTIRRAAMLRTLPFVVSLIGLE